MRSIDAMLNYVTMYRLVLYELIFLIFGAGTLGLLGVLPYTPLSIALSTAFIFCIALLTNAFFAWAYDAPTNPESSYITAFILALIITPPATLFDPAYLSLAGWATALAIASKYLLALNRKHLFNPVAVGVAITALVLNQSATWWIGTASMLPLVLVAGALVVRKMQRSMLLWLFIATSFIFIVGHAVLSGDDFISAFHHLAVSSPLFFFGTVMLTEPMTMPPSRAVQLLYGGGVALLFAPFLHLGSLYSTPELALLAGNLFSYLFSPKYKLALTLTGRKRLTHDTYDFTFTPSRPFRFMPGQYLEWTLPHDSPDARGIRRFFTIASSSAENEVHLGVKYYENGSTFKKQLLALRPGDTIIASQLAGDFVLPQDIKKKLVFIAGGIGITPFRSMIQHMLDTGQQRSVVLLYANKTPSDVSYHQLLARAGDEIGLKTIYAFTDPGAVPADLPSTTGIIDAALIQREVPDYRDRVFYLSGPQGMVTEYARMLTEMGVPRGNLKKDFFPGFA